MKQKMVLRMAGLVALCLVIGVVLAGALGGAQVQVTVPYTDPQVYLPGDPVFEALIAKTPKNRIPSVGAARSYDGIDWLLSVRECGHTIAGIAIDPEAREIKDPVAAARSLDDGPIFIGAARSLDDGSYLLDKAPLPRGEYQFWIEEIGMLGFTIPFEPDIDWYIIMTTISPDGKIDIRAILFYRDDVFRTPEQWLRIIGSFIGLREPCPEPEPEPVPPPPPEPPVT